MKNGELDGDAGKIPPKTQASNLSELPLPVGADLQEKRQSAIDCWQAQSFAARIHREFEASLEKGLTAGMKSRFYALFEYYEQAVSSLRTALKERNTAGLVSSLRSLIALNAPLNYMHSTAPNAIPLHLAMEPKLKGKLIRDLLIKVQEESIESMTAARLTEYINEHEFLQKTTKRTVERHLGHLVESGHLSKTNGAYERTNRTYMSTNLDDAGLQTLLGEELYIEFEMNGFPGLSNIENKTAEFKQFFEEMTDTGELVSELFLATITDLLGPESERPTIEQWHCRDLIGSSIPRPYQRDAFTIFRGHGYQGPLIEAPTGSGKTLIGMMAIQDWLKTTSPGESILVLVPTINYEQQWVRELCYKSIGLQLSPDDVFAGTPTDYEMKRQRSKTPPVVLIMTYAGLAQLGSPKGKGGFDKISLERFLQGSNTRYVILDEVHKVVQDMEGVSASVTSLLVDWLEDGSIEGLIGFSGTAKAYRERFEKLGLRLVYVVPSVDLIAYGFVAPFGELGVPFTYSDRESEMRSLLGSYKSLLRDYTDLVGSHFLRTTFSDIPFKKRLTIARDILDMYSYRKDRREAIKARFRRWRKEGDLGLNELSLISMIQIAKNLSDEALVRQTLVGYPEKTQRKRMIRFRRLLVKFRDVRLSLLGLVTSSEIASKLKVSGFGRRIQANALLESYQSIPTKKELEEKVDDTLSNTIAGLYRILRSLYYRMGEGRVEAISAVIQAERQVRDLNNVIVFGRGKSLDWRSGLAEPGYSGVAGIFSQMLGENELTPMAVLSSEVYLPFSRNQQIPMRIASFIKREIMGSDLSQTLFGLLTQGTQIPTKRLQAFKSSFDEIITSYVESLSSVGAWRPVEFDTEVLQPLIKTVNKLNLEERETIVSRLDTANPHLEKWMRGFYDYALIASRFSDAIESKLQQPNGGRQRFYVIKMAQGSKKQLMYDLTARIVDAKDLPINVIIVSRWARTGWDVTTPNLLIDATATRNVTAWQQLRGRTMRAMGAWDKDCYEAMMFLLGSRMGDTKNQEIESRLPDEEKTTALTLDKTTQDLLLEVHEKANVYIENRRFKKTLSDKIRQGDLSLFTDRERIKLAVELMMVRNKVTHIYELVKAYGSTTQIRFDRRAKEWRRRSAVSAKHSHNFSVNPFTGDYCKGSEHSPFVYVEDPREYSPTRLKAHLAKLLAGCDAKIVEGWIKAVMR
ncbi:MAG: DEAD/DEAH box helicase [Candidatus Lokiarchaeota archaeon]|nr:DEAD/DEAH box helicase [Candidatus Lokiarchaeota archaeon]